MHDTLVDSSPAPITDAPSRRAAQQPSGTIRKKLWRGGLAFAITALIFVIGWEFRMAKAEDHRLAFGHDLLPSYAAGLLVRQGRAAAMYDPQIVQTIEAAEIGRSHLDMDPRFGPWLNPPFFAWVFAPLAALSYREALGAFVFVNLLLLSASFILMRRMLFSSNRQFSNGPKKEDSPRRHGGTEARSKVGTDLAKNALLERRCCSNPRYSERLQIRCNEQGKDIGASQAPPCLRASVVNPSECVQNALQFEARSEARWKLFGLVPLLLASSMPFMQAFGHQQNTFLTLLILCITVFLWRRRAGFSAGLVAGLLAFKPQHAVLICGVLVLTLGWRALAGVVLTGIILLAITLFTMPGTLHGFLHDMPALVATIQSDPHYNWGRQVTFTSFWRLLVQGDAAGTPSLLVHALTWTCSGCVAIVLLGAAWPPVGSALRTVFASLARRAVRSADPTRKRVATDSLIAATIAAAPLIMPYYMDYDLVLLVIPAVLFAARWVAEPEKIGSADRVGLWAWVGLFLASYINPGFARVFHVNLTVLALVAVAGFHLWRAMADSGARESPID